MNDYTRRLGIQPTGDNADPTELIDWFDDDEDLGGTDPSDNDRNDFRFLSNFYPDEPFEVALEVDRRTWPVTRFQTGEHAFQAAKARSEAEFRRIAEAPTAGQAKALGRRTSLVPGWDASRFDVMRQVLNAKFAPGTHCSSLLTLTGNALLVEGTWWNDRIWGVDLRMPNTPGRNWLGVLLMARRAELRAC